MQERIKPISEPPFDLKRIEHLIGQLDHAKFAVRDKANKELVAFGELVITPLQKFLVDPPSEEARTRADKILKKVKEPVLTPERLQVLRMLAVLEYIDNREARELLQAAGEDHPWPRP